MKTEIYKTKDNYVLIINPGTIGSRRFILKNLDEVFSLIEEFFATS